MNNENMNVLFILTDDQGFWSMGCYGNDEIETPNLDRLAESGIRFDNFFCVSPVCSPARASLMTGKIPSQHGVHDWIRAGDTHDEKYEPDGKGVTIEYLANQRGYTEILAENGYNCGISGKWHMGDSHTPQKGLEYWEIHAKGGGPYYNAPMIHNGELYESKQYVTDLITDNGIKFLEQQKDSNKPFYLSVHYTAPHSPWGRDNHPEDIYDNYFNNCPFKSVPNGLTPPDWVERLNIPVKNEEVRRDYLSGYYAAVTAMDRGVGQLIDWLEENGLRENTLICFTSDNGMNMGHHGIYGKGNATFPVNMYEESVKVPFLISCPNLIEKGRTSEALLSHYDFMPTLLELAGFENPDADQLPGQSFLQLLKGGESTRDDVIIYDEYGPVRMIRTADWKYIHRYPFGPNELYNLKADPQEEGNLIDDESSIAMKEELKSKLDNWFCQYVDPAKDGAHEAVNGNGQLNLCGPAGKGKKAFA